MLRVIGNDINLPRQEPFITNSAFSNGKPVLMNADGTVGGPFNATSILNAEAGHLTKIATNGSGTFLAMYTFAGGAYPGKVVAGTISGNTVTLGAATQWTAEANLGNQGQDIIYDPDSDKFILFYQAAALGNYLAAIVATVSGTSVSFGSQVVIDSRSVPIMAAAYDTSANKAVVAWKGTGSNIVAAAVGTVSGTSISFGSTATLASRTPNTSIATVYDAYANKTAVFYQDNSTGHGYYVVGTVSGTSISGGSTAAFHAASTGGGINAEYDPDNYKIVVLYGDGGNNDYGTAVVGTISGTSMSFGSEAVYSGTSVSADADIAYDTANNKFFIFYDKASGGVRGLIGTVSGTSISFGSESTISSANVTHTDVAYDASAGKALVVYRDTGNSHYPTLQVLGNSFALTNFTSESYIGISAGRNIVTSRTQAIGSETVFESGDIAQSGIGFDSTNNKVVIAYRDANNSNYSTAIVGTVDPSDNSISFGSSAVYTNNSTADAHVRFDSNSGKVVIVYYDGGNSNYGTAVVGTVSGTSISFGTPVVYNSGNATTNLAATFDSNSNKIVISYKDGAQSDHGKAIVGTVSGTSISFGSEVTFNAATTSDKSMTFDSTNNKVVIVYQDSGNSGHGTAIVGTVSGTSISFGSEVVYNTNNSPDNAVAFDPVSGKVVVFYEHTSNALYGVVGTVSGTSISFGTAVQFGSDTNMAYPNAVFDSSAGKVVLAYQGGSKGKAISATVSGTSLTFDTGINIFDGDATYNDVAYDSTNERLVFSGRDQTSTNGKARVLSLGFNNISRGQVASGKTVLVDTQGAISKNHSALTPGQQYFVQSDGSIGTTADSPSVFAGTAISATELIVKG